MVDQKNGIHATWLHSTLAGGAAFLAAWAALTQPLEDKVELSDKQRQESEARGIADLRATESRLLKELARVEHDLTQSKERSNANRNDIVSLVEKLVEVETQFGATSQIRNAQRESDMQRVALLWQRVYQEPLPLDNSFYPHVGNGHKGGQK